MSLESRISAAIATIGIDVKGINARFPTLVSALPGSPTNGQEVYFQNSAMAALGIVWHLRYRSAASGSYKWEFVGGTPMIAGYAASEAVTTTVADLSGPSFTVPLAGDYIIDLTVSGSSNGAGQYVEVRLYCGAVMVNNWYAVSYTSNYSAQISACAIRVNAIAAGATIKLMYASSTTSNVTGRTLSALPIRVG